jgi:hypothetical protein
MGSLVIADVPLKRPIWSPFTYSWQTYLTLSNDELARLDIAAVNLQCALGLPGSERIDVAGCIRTIESWVPVVRRWTEAAYLEYFLRDPSQFPA